MQIAEKRVFCSRILLLLLVLVPFGLAAQFSDGPVEIDAYGNSGFSQNHKELNVRNLKAAMKSNPHSTALMNKAAVNYAWSQVMSFIGGFALGREAVIIIRGESVNELIIAAGVVFIGGALVLVKAYRDNAMEAVNYHNAYLQGKHPANGEARMELKLGTTPSGVGFTLNF